MCPLEWTGPRLQPSLSGVFVVRVAPGKMPGRCACCKGSRGHDLAQEHICWATDSFCFPDAGARSEIVLHSPGSFLASGQDNVCVLLWWGTLASTGCSCHQGQRPEVAGLQWGSGLSLGFPACSWSPPLQLPSLPMKYQGNSLTETASPASTIASGQFPIKENLSSVYIILSSPRSYLSLGCRKLSAFYLPLWTFL